MEPTWSMRPYTNGDEEGVFDLWKEVYPQRQYDREQWLRWWRWLYQDNPSGEGLIWLAEHNGKIVGQLGFVPVVMEIAGKTALGAQVLDAMIHPAYRRQKIFDTLARKVMHESKEKGMFILYALPNQFSHPGARKLNWLDIASLPVMVKPFNWRKTLKSKVNNEFLLELGAIGGGIVEHTLYRTKKAPVVPDLTISQVSTFDKRINDFWARVSGQYQIMVVRNRDYLNWRFTAVPDTAYLIYIAEISREICGYIIFRYIRSGDIMTALIFDILVSSEQIARLLISKATECCRQEKIDCVFCQIIANKAYYKAFKKCGFISLPFTKALTFCAYSNSPDISMNFLQNSKNWLAQTGDLDQI